jgi:hypothetical protein
LTPPQAFHWSARHRLGEVQREHSADLVEALVRRRELAAVGAARGEEAFARQPVDLALPEHPLEVGVDDGIVGGVALDERAGNAEILQVLPLRCGVEAPVGCDDGLRLPSSDTGLERRDGGVVLRRRLDLRHVAVETEPFDGSSRDATGVVPADDDEASVLELTHVLARRRGDLQRGGADRARFHRVA